MLTRKYFFNYLSESFFCFDLTRAARELRRAYWIDLTGHMTQRSSHEACESLPPKQKKRLTQILGLPLHLNIIKTTVVSTSRIEFSFAVYFCRYVFLAH